MKPTIGKTESGKDMIIDVPRLLLTRMLVQASSGGGKSFALRRILEQTASHVQQVILDIEGEFTTLREKFDYIICAPYGADAVATPQTATILARRLRETRASAIIDLYEMKMPDRKKFVRLFLEEFVEAPKSMWHPCIVVVDEAHHFCPEKDEAESMAAVNDLITRGRKRGLCGILATQRLSKLNKDSAAELHNKLLGLAVLDTDIKRASDDLGLSAKVATPVLRSLDPGEFFAFGPALNRIVTKIKVGPVITTHPEAGSGATLAPPPPSAKIKELLAKLTDLPQVAEQEARTLADYKREVANLKRELTLAQKAQPKQPATEIKRIEVPVVGMKAIKGIQAADASMRKNLKKMHELKHAINETLYGYQQSLDKLLGEISKVNTYKATTQTVIGKMPPALVKGLDKAGVLTRELPSLPKGNGALGGPQQRIVDAIAWMESIGVNEPETTAVAFLAGYVVGGGAFNNPRGSLRVAGLIEYRGSKLALTEEGRKLANVPDAELTPEAIQQRVLERLPTPERKLLTVALAAYPNDIQDQELAERTGYAAGGGAFNNPKGRLRTLGLVTYPSSKRVRAADILFPGV
jgi:hypothetical protein